MPDIKVNFTTDSGQIEFDHEFAKASIEGSVKDFSIGSGTGHVELLTVSGDAVVGRVK